MPNHVDNDLSIEGTVKDIDAFIAAVRGENEDGSVSLIDANKLIPMPEKFKGMEGFNKGGYEWCCKEWGTKWGFYSLSKWTKVKTGRKASITFNTAWSPAIPLFKAMAKKFPNITLTVKYFEQGMQFQGVFKAKGGEVLEDSTKPYSGSRGG